jgi:hypothetical protein
MFDKKYILINLYQPFARDIELEEWIQFWLEEFSPLLYNDIERIINITRDIERNKDRFIKKFNERKDKKILDSYNQKNEQN